eukprot:Colp12_sorted_trinity150504_noHs@33094
MFRFNLEAKLPLDFTTYVNDFETPEFRKLQCHVLGLKSIEDMGTWAQGDREYRRVRTVLNWTIPAFLSRFTGSREVAADDIIEEDIERTNSSRLEYRFISTFPFLPDEFVRVGGHVIVEPVDEHTCKQTITAEVSVALAWVGPYLEAFVVSKYKHTYNLLPDIVQLWREEKLQKREAERLRASASPSQRPRGSSTASIGSRTSFKHQRSLRDVTYNDLKSPSATTLQGLSTSSVDMHGHDQRRMHRRTGSFDFKTAFTRPTLSRQNSCEFKAGASSRNSMNSSDLIESHNGWGGFTRSPSVLRKDPKVQTVLRGLNSITNSSNVYCANSHSSRKPVCSPAGLLITTQPTPVAIKR